MGAHKDTRLHTHIHKHTLTCHFYHTCTTQKHINVNIHNHTHLYTTIQPQMPIYTTEHKKRTTYIHTYNKTDNDSSSSVCVPTILPPVLLCSVHFEVIARAFLCARVCPKNNVLIGRRDLWTPTQGAKQRRKKTLWTFEKKSTKIYGFLMEEKWEKSTKKKVILTIVGFWWKYF